MKINSYAIGMDSERTYSSLSTRRFNIRMLRTGEEKPEQNFSSVKGEDGRTPEMLWERFSGVGEIATERIEQADSSPILRDIQSVRQQFVLYLWRLLFGDREAMNMAREYGMSNLDSANSNSIHGVGQNSPFSVIKLSGIEENYYSEQETLDFVSSGNVTTADGRSIDFSVNLHMSRSFEEYYRKEGLEIPQMCDPLVLNFCGDIDVLSDVKFEFDLDCDGEKEIISRLCNGGGCLALDKNGDGMINDGSELFGTKSGDGFADLTEYDEDGNGWIDENDSVFDKLKIWVMDEDGRETLLNLRDKNVGAIFLGNSKNDFSLRSSQAGNLNGVIRSMGMFLYEDGNVGIMSQIDMAD